ncbi:MAG TPA: acyltransferase [Puia sp.]|nr:acyltransferase [Puia sp.]
MQQPSRVPWIDYLRGFITLLVVAHHSSLAYTTFAHFNPTAYIASTHPVVDTIRWRGLDIFEDFNDIFFMSLMFLISGIFVMQSIAKKGTALFIRDRFHRLFIPFAIGVTVLMLTAYYPAYLLAHGRHDIKAYVIDFFTVESWPVGPPWFIWVLFLFNLLFALTYRFTQGWLTKAGAVMAVLKRHPARLVAAWYILTWIVYVPAVLLVGPSVWTGIGPFDFQVSRILLYLGYFLLGIAVGGTGLPYRRWPFWLIGCLSVYALLKWSEAPIGRLRDQHTLSVLQARLIYRSLWTLSCTLSCITFLTVFKNLFKRSRAWWDSLSANAYGIYLIHYIFVLWCQYFLLDAALPAVVKFLITFILALTVSWSLTWAVRKIGVVAKYL